MERRYLVPELAVSDFAASLRFYVGVLGFTVKYQRKNPSFAYLEIEGAQLMLEERQDDSWVVGELTHPFGRGINLQIECSNVTDIRSRIGTAGLEVFAEIHDAYYEAGGETIHQRQFLVTDPDGYLLRFCQVL